MLGEPHSFDLDSQLFQAMEYRSVQLSELKEQTTAATITFEIPLK